MPSRKKFGVAFALLSAPALMGQSELTAPTDLVCLALVGCVHLARPTAPGPRPKAVEGNPGPALDAPSHRGGGTAETQPPAPSRPGATKTVPDR